MGMYCISSYTILVGVTAAQTDTKQTLMLGVDGHLNKVRMHPDTLTQYKCYRQKVYKQLLKYMGLLINKKVNTQSTQAVQSLQILFLRFQMAKVSMKIDRTYNSNAYLFI